MRVNELRLGNYVYDNLGGVLKIKGVSEESSTQHLKPIIITEKWLLDLGLKECYRSDYTVKYELESNQSIEYIFREVNNQKFFRVYGFDFKCDFVHDLQNKIFALTGEELTLKQE